jgi:hypothetical protein
LLPDCRAVESFALDWKGGRLARSVQLNTDLLSWLDNVAVPRWRLRSAISAIGPDFDLENEGS